MEENKFCQIHNSPALFCEEESPDQMQYLCQYCILKKYKIQSVDEMNIKLKAQQLKEILKHLRQYQQQVQQKLEKQINLIEQKISFIIEKGDDIQKLNKNPSSLHFKQIQEQENKFELELEQIKKQLNQMFSDLYNTQKIEKLQSMINYFNSQSSKSQSDIIDLNNVPTVKFDYQLIEQLCYKQNEYCGAMAFNNDASLMVASCSKLIKVFDLQRNQLQEVQQLKGHNNQVYCLQFMKKSNQFISASCDSMIIIWEQNQNNEWENIQQLIDHQNWVFCIALNQEEDLLISGSNDKTIKFWKNQNNSWKQNFTLDCQSGVYSLSLNNSGNQLIASILNKKILVIQQQGDQWNVLQTIEVQCLGYRLSFIDQNGFVFQPYDQQHLIVYDNDNIEQIFKEHEQIKYSNKGFDGNARFPISFISKLGLVLVKNDEYLHLIRRINRNYIVDQSIHFGTNNLYGCISNDGQLIATWDNKSNQIQIRKLNEI